MKGEHLRRRREAWERIPTEEANKQMKREDAERIIKLKGLRIIEKIELVRKHDMNNYEVKDISQ